MGKMCSTNVYPSSLLLLKMAESSALPHRESRLNEEEKKPNVKLSSCSQFEPPQERHGCVGLHLNTS